MTVLQRAAYYNKQSFIDAVRNSVSDEEWIQLLYTPIRKYNQRNRNDGRYQGAVDLIDELRAAARVKCVLQTGNNSGM